MAAEMKVTPRLAQLREDRGDKRYVLAALVDVGEPTVYRWERGDQVIPTLKAKKLADYFGVTVGYLLGYEDEPEPTRVAA